MKHILILLTVTFISNLSHASSSVSWDMKLNSDNQSVSLTLKNNTYDNLICDSIEIYFSIKNGEIGETVQRSNLYLKNILLNSNENKTVILGQDIFDQLDTVDKDFSYMSNFKVNNLECRPLSFLEYIRSSQITTDEEKFLIILKKAFRVINNEEVESNLKKITSLYITPSKETLRDPLKRGSLNSAMSLSLLRFFPHLESITIKYLGVSSLNGIETLHSLKTLDLTGNVNLNDLSPIAKLQSLRTLDISNTGVVNLEPLRTISSLKNINIQGTGIADLGWLLQPNELECIVFDRIKIKSDKSLSELLKKSREQFNSCANDIAIGNKWSF